MDKEFVITVHVKCTEAQVQVLNDALIEAAEAQGLHIVTIIPEVADDDQD